MWFRIRIWIRVRIWLWKWIRVQGLWYRDQDKGWHGVLDMGEGVIQDQDEDEDWDMDQYMDQDQDQEMDYDMGWDYGVRQG